MSTLHRAAILFALALAACAAEDAGSSSAPEVPGDDPTPAPAVRFGGPLANAGADQRALPGMPVRLDGRASLPGEEGLAIGMFWTQEAGPRVALDDPTAAEPTFIAPPIRATGGDRLVFLLTVHDGRQASTDRVVVHLVDEPSQLLPAPIALAGEDLAVQRGVEVELPAPFTLDPACIDEGGAEGCEREPIPTRYVQVEGPPVTLLGRRFVAPDRATVLTFRLDGHRRQAEERLADCAPGGAISPAAFCSAADYLRVHVLASGVDRAPVVDRITVDVPDREPKRIEGRGAIERVGPARDAGSYVDAVEFQMRATDPEADRVLLRGFRPLLPGAPAGLLDWDSQITELSRGIAADGARDAILGMRPDLGAWPRTTAVAFEARAARLFAAPAAAVVRWEPPAGGPAVPIANAGGDPCSGPGCMPFVGGETVVLDASGTIAPPETPPSELLYCWLQTLGPAVAFDEGGDCLQGEPRRTFVAPEAPPGKPLLLAFVLTVSNGGPLVSVPDTALVQIRPADNQPPSIDVSAPAVVAEGATARMDASRSFDPEGGGLAFRWRQLAPASPLVRLSPYFPCSQPIAAANACVEFVAPRVERDTLFRFRLTVTDDAPLDAVRDLEVLVREAINEPPIVDAGDDRVVAPGAQVEILATATDPNPGHEEALLFAWQVVQGEVALEGADSPTVRFTAPETEEELEIVLEVSVEDPAGAQAIDRVSVFVRPDATAP